MLAHGPPAPAPLVSFMPRVLVTAGVNHVTCHVSRVTPPWHKHAHNHVYHIAPSINGFVCLDRSSGADAAAKIYFVSSVVGGSIYANAGI